MNNPRPSDEELAIYPGGELVAKGLSDLENHITSEEALLVLIASPRLRRLGFVFQDDQTAREPYEHLLYSALEERLPRGAHSAYNALIQRVVSFTDSYRPPR